MNQNWKEKEYSYFCHEKCEFFPCHAGADRENFNCLFCYCPLYALGERCGGDFVYNEKGIKDCTACLFPHKREKKASRTAPPASSPINGKTTVKS